jgi:hypothetical protein
LRGPRGEVDRHAEGTRGDAPQSTAVLLPVEGGLYFDRTYGSLIRFEPGQQIDRNGSDELAA